MRTVARCAQLLFGHRSPVGALRWRMSRRRENDARWNIGTFPTKRQRKKGNEIERRCACRRKRWQWQNPCREAFEGCESWQTEGMYAVTTDAMEANGGRQRSNNKCLRPECLVEAAAKDFESFDDWKAGCNAGTAKAYCQRAWWKLPGGSRSILGVLTVLRVVRVWRLANGRLQRPNNRGLCAGKQQVATLEQQGLTGTAGAYGNSRGLRPP